jgi:leucyl aminopeptidase
MVGMKDDMAGAAAVIGTFVSLAANQLPYHVIGLIPSTDNRPGYNAYTPNDVIQMYDGTWVEVLNTDAEGRMILADALAWAKQYNPALVIDLATLTGAAVIAVGQVATALYSTADTVVTQRLLEAAESTFERCVQFPLWDEYGEMIKSDVGDIKNIGQGRYAGSITAAKFLQHFTAYPWVHLDIAGPAYLDAASQYRPKYGTGVGVRLLTEFIRRFGS